MFKLGVLLALLIVLFGQPAAGASPHQVPVRLSWAPTPAQVDRWRLSHEPRPGPVCVSLKVALPANAGPCGLRIVEEAWLPEPDHPAPSSPAVSLGRRGTWRGIPYQEVLVRPVCPSVSGGEPHILGRLVADVLNGPEDGPLREASAPERSATPEARLFINSEEAIPSGPPMRFSFPHPEASALTGLSSPALRISVSQDGIYRLDYNYLRVHGLDLAGLAASNIHLMCRGVEIPVAIKGPVNKNFGKKNSIIFYGQKLSIRDRPIFQGGDFTDTNAYWLYGDTSPGRRMAVTKVKPAGSSPAVPTFTATVHAEVNNFYAVVDHFRPNGDNWFWGPALIAQAGSPSPAHDYTVMLPHASGAATVTSVLAGVQSGDHAVSIRLNGIAPDGGQDPATWSGQVLETATWSWSAAAVSGDNTLELTLPGFPSHSDVQLLDFFDVSYVRTFDADGEALRFTVPATDARYRSSGYSAAPLILDLSSKDDGTGLFLPVLLKGATLSGRKVTFHMSADSGASGRTVALSSSPLQPDDAQLSSGVDLSDPALGADLLVITHPDFHPQGQDSAWEAYLSRRRQGMEVAVVDIQDVYDNFSYGIFDPTAIRSFVTAASANWRKAPKYVLLIGDGTYDYKNYKADPVFKNWVPTMMFEDVDDASYIGQYPSDSWYADMDSDGYPDMAVGRLPVASYDELAGVLGKIATYEDQPQTGDWAYKTLFVAGDITEPWEEEFETFNDDLCATYIHPPHICVKVYCQEPDADTCAATIRLDWPSSLVHYMGHAGFRSWGKNKAIFTSYPSRNCGSGTCTDSDVDLLPAISAEEAPLPFVLNSACYVSGFDELGAPSLMEALMVRPDGGCIGSAGFSTIAYPDEEETFNGTIFSQIFLPPGERTAGDLVEAGRFSLASSDARSVFGAILMGDPTQTLRIP